MQNAVALDIRDQLLHNVVGIVTEVECAGTGKEVDILLAILVHHHCTLRFGEHRRKATAIGAHVGFIVFKCHGIHRQNFLQYKFLHTL